MRHRENIIRQAKPSSPGTGTMLVLGVGLGWILLGGYATMASVTPGGATSFGAFLLAVVLFYRWLSRSDAVVSVEERAPALERREIRSQPRLPLSLSQGSTTKPHEQRTIPTVPRASALQEKSQAKSDTLVKLTSRLRAIRDSVEEISSKQRGPTTDFSADKTVLGLQLEALEQLARRLEMIALNAAIEAARAKEYGSGFSLVAKEMRGISEKIKNAVELGKNALKSDQFSSRVDATDLHSLIPIVEELRQIHDEQQNALALEVKEAKAELSPPSKQVVLPSEGIKTVSSTPKKTVLATPAPAPAPVKGVIQLGVAPSKKLPLKSSARFRSGASSRVNGPFKVTPTHEKKSFRPVRAERTLMAPLRTTKGDPSVPLGVIVLEKGAPSEKTPNPSLKLEQDGSKLVGGPDDEDEHFERF